MFRPSNFCVVSGTGKSQFPLAAFDNALCNAGIGDFNLVKVSSILPVNCTYQEHLPQGDGSILYAAYATVTVKEGETASAAVAVAIPSATNLSGVIFETSAYNARQNMENNVRTMCCEAMKNRNKEFSEIKSVSEEITGEKDYFTAAISAVVLW